MSVMRTCFCCTLMSPSAWKRGQSWQTPPNPIPINYLTSAASLWKQGESYIYDATAQPPQCWKKTSGGAEVALAASSVVRTISQDAYTPGSAVDVAIAVTTGGDARLRPPANSAG